MQANTPRIWNESRIQIAMPAFIATVGYVRSLNIGTLSVYCEGKRAGGYQCNDQADIDLAPYPGELPCSAIERQLVCTYCGAIDAVDARPNWAELAGASGCGERPLRGTAHMTRLCRGRRQSVNGPFRHFFRASEVLRTGHS